VKPHAIKEYIAYLYKAKNLHGVHSPFAYEFAEKVLSDKQAISAPDGLKLYNWLPKPYYTLLAKLTAYYNYNNLLCLTEDNEEDPTSYDFILMKDLKPGDWVRLFNKYLPHLKSNSGCMIAGIHKTKRHSSKWHRLRKHPRVMMSIDLYGVGLLFFRKEFKEKQHFILKY
jgi:hypothetical protein